MGVGDQAPLDTPWLTDEGLRLFVASVKDYAIFLLDVDGRVATWNPGAERLSGYSTADVVGKHFSIFYSEADRRRGYPEAALRRAVAEGSLAADGWRVRKNGSHFHVQVTITALRDSTGALRGFGKVTRDMTEVEDLRRRASHLDPSESEERIRSVVNNVLDGIITIDAAGRIESLNPAAEKLFGWSSAELLGENVKLLMPEPYRGEHDGYLANYLRTGRPKIIGIGREVTGKRRDGSLFPMDLAVSEFSAGDRRFFTGIVRDITERKRAEADRVRLVEEQTRRAESEARQAALRQSEERFRTLFESAPDPLIGVGPDGTIRLMNAQAESVFRCGPGGLIGLRVEQLLPERFREAHRDHRQRYADSPTFRPMGAGRSLHGLRQDGTEFPAEVSLSPLRTEEGVVVLAAVRDVTERRRAEEQIRASLLEKEVLLREIHHRVKNNLQVVTSLLSLQSRKTRDETVRTLLRESQDRVRSMALVHEKLYRSRTLATLDMESYLHELVASLFRSYGSEAALIDRRVEAKEVALGIDALVPLGLIVNELVSNALKHAFSPGSRGRVRVELLRGDAELVQLVVSDDGGGMPGDFEARKAASLGLQLVDNLASQLHGRVEARSAGGTTFTVTFPAAPGAASGRARGGQEP